MRKNPIQTEIKRRGRCWHVYRQQQRVLVSTWERVNGTPLRGAGGTQVSASTLPQGRWRSDAYETRQRRIHAPQGLLLLCRLSLYLAFPLYSGTASLSEQAAMDTMGDTRSDLAECKYVFFLLVDVVLYQGLEQRKRTGRHKWFNCMHSLPNIMNSVR